jgi:hypothetical protein
VWARLLVPLLLVAACRAPTTEIVVEVDADDAVIERLERVSIALDDSGSTIASDDVTLSGTAPNCLPLSIGVAPKPGHEALPVDIVVTGAFFGGATIVHRVDTRFAAGLHRLPIAFGPECATSTASCQKSESISTLESVDRSALAARIQGTKCKQRTDPIACIGEGRCFAAVSSPPICSACPPPPTPDPVKPPADVQPIVSPMLGCPLGWSTEAPDPMDGVTACEPWSKGQRISCPGGEARFPGDPACAELQPCPSGRFAGGLPAGTIYVDPSAAAGGDGSLGAPLQTLDQALTRAVTGGAIALSKGTHAASAASIVRAIEIAGACASMTTVMPSVNGSAALFTITSSSVRIHDLSIAHAGDAVDVMAEGVLHLDRIFVLMPSGAALHVIGGGRAIGTAIVVESAGQAAIRVEGAGRASIDRLFVHGSIGALLASDAGSIAAISRFAVEDAVEGPPGVSGFAISASGGAEVDAFTGIVERAPDHAFLAVDANTSLAISDVIVRDGSPSRDGMNGHAVSIERASSSSLNRVLIERVEDAAVEIEAGSSAMLFDVVVRDVTRASAGALGGYGIACDGCMLGGARISIERGTEHALDARGAAEVDLFDVYAGDPQLDASKSHGNALALADMARVRITRALFERATDVADFLFPSTRLEMSDLVVRDTASQPSGDAGHGMFLREGAYAAVRRGRFEGNHDSAVEMWTGTSTNATLLLEDVTIRGTRASPNAVDSGFGLDLGLDSDSHPLAIAILRRTHLDDNRTDGILAKSTALYLEDVLVENTQDAEPSSVEGFGIWARSRSKVTGLRAAFVANTNANVHVTDQGTDLDLSDVVLSHAACPTTTFEACMLGGTGLASEVMGHAHLRRFSIEANAQDGVQISENGSVDLEDGAIVGNKIGALVRQSYDLSRIALRVDYMNDANIQAGP